MTQGWKLTWRGDEIIAALQAEMPGALFADGEQLVRAAAGKVSSRTGTLAESGYVAMEGRSTYKANKLHRRELQPQKDAVIVAFAAFYAKFVEFGTRKRAAQPYLRPAIDEMRGSISGRVADRLRKSLKKFEAR